MSIIVRLGVLESKRDALIRKQIPHLEVVSAKSWDEFKLFLKDAHIVYLPHFVLRTLPYDHKAATGELFRLDAKTRKRHSLPEYVVSGNARLCAPQNKREAAQRLAEDILSNIQRSNIAKAKKALVAVWSGFFVEPISLAHFVKFLGAQLQAKGSGKSHREVRNNIQMLQAEAEIVRRQKLATAIARIKEAIDTHGITAMDLGFDPVRPTLARTNPRVQAMKYSNNQGGTWSGRGKKPAWLAQALESGRTLEDFAVKVTSDRAAKHSGENRVGTAPEGLKKPVSNNG